MDQEATRVVYDAQLVTGWLWRICEILDKMQEAGFFQVKDVLPKDAFIAWSDEKQIRAMEENARKAQEISTKKRREVLSKLTEAERLAIGYPQVLSKNPNYPIYHVAEKVDRKQTTAAP